VKLRARFSWVSLVKTVDKVWSILCILSRFPRVFGNRVVSLMNKILQPSLRYSRIKDGLDYKFSFSLNNDRRKRPGSATRDWVWSVFF
jgi:hypothetical protein